MAREQDPTAADIAYAQYLAAAEKTRMVGGCVYHRIICKTPLPAPAGGVERSCRGRCFAVREPDVSRTSAAGCSGFQPR